jgi:hypothetical protein
MGRVFDPPDPSHDKADRVGLWSACVGPDECDNPLRTGVADLYEGGPLFVPMGGYSQEGSVVTEWKYENSVATMNVFHPESNLHQFLAQNKGHYNLKCKEAPSVLNIGRDIIEYAKSNNLVGETGPINCDIPLEQLFGEKIITPAVLGVKIREHISPLRVITRFHYTRVTSLPMNTKQ